MMGKMLMWYVNLKNFDQSFIEISTYIINDAIINENNNIMNDQSELVWCLTSNVSYQIIVQHAETKGS